ncbi:MAG TPA: hypothetical protein VHP37_13940 [Burkholderiales bacterium]|nr:hypothetical protein [Burkholderiales bacterium]
MTTIALFRKHKQQRAPEKRERAADSLDFRDVAPAKPAQTPGAQYVAKPKKPTVKVIEPAPKPRGGIVLPAAIAGVLALGIAYMTREPSTEVHAPAAPVKAAPAPVQKAPEHVAPKAHKPAVTASVTPPQPPAPRVNIPAVPTAFLAPFQAYTTESGAKAIALALDKDGRFAHAVVARHPVQAEANGEALADCERYRAEAGIQQPCRLFAIGDKIVW